MCNEAVRRKPYTLRYVSDHFITQEMCSKAVEEDPWLLWCVPDPFKTQEMCDKAVRDYPFSLQFVSDYFVTQQQIDVWYDDHYWHHDDEIIEWYHDYQKRKTQKVKIKDELVTITWHPDCVMDWSMSEDEKGWWK